MERYKRADSLNMQNKPDFVMMWKLQLVVAIGLNIFVISLSEATKICPVNEEYDYCPAPCPPRECGVDPAVTLCAPSPKPGDPECKPGCRCCDGYLRNFNGTCIPEDQCPPQDNCNQCPVNEIYEECLTSCPPRFCGVNIAAVSCTPSPNPGDPDCKPGCRCRDFTLRNGNGTCIPEEQCPTCPKNEVYDVCPALCPPRRCDVDERVIRCAAPPQYGDPECKPGCRCADGYVRNSNGKCVTRDQCPPICGKNEVISNCTNSGCGPKTCSTVGYPIGCIKMDPKNCKAGCVCKDGYVRDDDNNCVDKKECPSCGGDPHAVSGCGVNCGRHCSDYNIEPVACIDTCDDNGCDCVKGYVYDDNVEKCVLPEDCTPVCGNDEVFSECSNDGCDAKTCSDLGKSMPCVKPEKCKPGCLCKKGYLRTYNGICVPKDQCQEQCTGPNEYFSCGPACDNVCATLSEQNKTNCPIVNVKCNPMCYCEDGYARDANNICIPISECPATPKCCDDEEYVKCPDLLCEPQKCSELGFPIKCPVQSSSDACPGPPGCVCANSMVRDRNGKCVPRDQCPSCGGDPNAKSGCGVCDNTCSNTAGPVICPRICLSNACNCKKGFVRDGNTGKCVLPKQCTPVCGYNEVYSNCTNGGCQAKNCTQLGKPIPCVKIDPKSCIKGCLCKDGYLRAGNGTCVPTNQCDQCNKLNEIYDDCAPTCPPQTCESINRTYDCPIQPQVCRGACRCKKGFYRNKIGECIPKQDCLKCTGPNEYFSCGGACDNVCATLNEQNQTNCPIVNIKCNPMCYCEEGYARDCDNNCIPISQCPSTVCGVNEVYDSCSNGGCKKRLCSEYSGPTICRDPLNCEGGCVCRDGYLRNDDGTCIPQDQCPITCNQPHEVYVNCPPTCPPETCESIGKEYSCPAQIIGDTTNCKGACRCEDGYFRNAIGQCISENDCLKCTGPNEYFSCGGACDNVCATLSKQNQTNCPIVNIKCNPMCYCEDGYARDSNNTCIPISQCPALPTCPKGERLEFCPQVLCEPEKCSDLGYPLNCNDDQNCTGPPKCVCDNEYVRNSKGKCVPKSSCPSCGGDKNAQAGCGVNCGRRCSNYKKRGVACPLFCKLNGCDCKKGFVLDDNTGKCVHPKDCTPSCGLYEVYDGCANGGCTKRNCSQLRGPTLCIDPIKCTGGCVCQKGYLRAKNGSCVPASKCPGGCGKNEQYAECPSSVCVEQYCTDLGFPIDCPPSTNSSSCDGDPGCICKEGFVRNDDGICILKEHCPSCGDDPNAESGCGINCGRLCSNYNKGPVACPAVCYANGCDCKKGYVYDDNQKKCVLPENCIQCDGPNEHYACGGACDNVCATLNKQNQTHCPIKNIKCNPKCYCDVGYARDSNNICIPIKRCGASPTCPKGERLESCPRDNCVPEKCSELGFPLNCNNNGTCAGPHRCVCKDDHVRDNNGKCVPKLSCPSCGGDKNAQAGCGVNCGRRCSNYNKKDVICPLFCNLNGCDCKKGFVLDDNTRKCVRPKDCTPSCGLHEVYDRCANGGCTKRNCSQLRGPALCRDRIKCTGGCVCLKGYLRDKNGSCVPASKCPGGCGKNEQYAECPSSVCVEQYCTDLGFPIDCPPSTNSLSCDGGPGCICKEGFVRNDDGICILKEHCPSCGGDPNAESGCGINCGRLCSNYNKGPVACPAVCYANGCDCKKGYVYDDNQKKCVLPENCIQCDGPNEHYACGGACDNVCATLYKQNQTHCPIKNIKCNPKCYCDVGYARDSNNICIPIKRCGASPTCPKGERLESCPRDNCVPEKCSELGFPLNCNNNGTCAGPHRCVCKDDHVRDNNGKCVPKLSCPSCGGDKNAQAGCGVNCGRRCSNYNKKDVICPLFCNLNGCDCKKGFVLDDNTRKCVRPKDCTPSCGLYEVYDGCANGGCTKRNCSQLRGPTLCIDPIKCTGGCVCQKGYLRAKNGSCVPASKCPGGCGKNEQYAECPSSVCVEQYCTDLGFPIDCPPSTISSSCDGDPGCICKEGFVRNDDGICILKEHCPSCGGDPNAESGCGINCGRLCSNYNKGPVACPAVCYANGCDCKKGYVYDDNQKKCVLPENCITCDGPNEHYACGGACDNVCATLYKQNQTHCPIKNIKCNPKCYCDVGYARDSNNICIPIKRCGASPTCPKGERLESCPRDNCVPEKCSELGFPLNCYYNGTCAGPPRCVCKDDNVRDNNGKCIPKSSCPSCGGDRNAQAGCGVNCGRLCSNYNKTGVNKAACPFICNLNGCDCKHGFVLDDNTGKCVRPKDCSKCTQPHEVYVNCPPSCRPQTCESIGKTYNCPLEKVGDTTNCKGACRCKDGYFRNAIGECIRKNDCLKCTGPHEYFSCGGACDNVCATLSQQNKTNCPIVNIKCNPMCYCKDGYARDSNKICIPISQCPAPPTCPKGERLKSCPRDDCVPEKCSELGFPLKCNNNGTCAGPHRCVCKDDHVRDNNGKCVPKSSCPSCGGDKNAEAGCGANCGNLCSNYKKEGVICPLLCNLNGCECRKGFVFDVNIGKCVRPRDCTPICGSHEVYDGCANGGCNKRNCSQLRDPTLCIDPIKCIGGCVCQKGYLRTKNGSCVPASQCPGGCGKNEQYVQCTSSTCAEQYCTDLGFPNSCPPSTNSLSCDGDPGCICKEDFVRNDDGICILKEHCLTCNGPNEHYACGGACDNVCATLYKQNQTHCPIKNKKCNPKCYCDVGYARDSNNICIPIKQCGESCSGDTNAVPGCGINCNRHCSNYNKKPGACPHVCKVGGCDCKQNYVFDDNTQKCVLPKDCSTEDYCDDMDETTTALTPVVNKTDAQARFNEACNKMAGEFLYQIMTDNPNTNSVASAPSVLIALAQVALFSTGLVLQQLLTVLNLKNQDEIRAIFPDLINNYRDQQNVTFEIASKYYANIRDQLSQNFEEQSKAYFDANGENIDFSKNDQAAQIINDWVSSQTHGKIQNLISPDALGADTRLVLINAIYFMGDWVHKFNKDSTEYDEFCTNDDKTVSVEMMHQENYFNYFEDDTTQILDMDYAGGNFSCFIILPKDRNLSLAIESLRDGKRLTNVRNGMRREKVRVSLPKMNIDSSLDIGDMLKKDKVTAIFDPNSDGLSGILEKYEPISVSAIVQKAYITVDEEGSVAAAATGVIITRSLSIPVNPIPVIVFNANHPFLILIAFEDVILFSGYVVN